MVICSFAERLKGLRGNASKDSVSNALGLHPQTYGRYEKGTRKPDSEILTRIAEYYNVSVDYLLGLREERTTDPNIQNAVEYTGLSESAAEKLHNAIDSNPYMALVISFLIDSFAATVGENEIPAIYRNLSFAIWGDLISYPAEKRCNIMDGSTFWRHDVDVLEKRTNQRTTIDTDVFPAAVFQRIITRLDKLRDKEQSEKHSEYLDKFVETVKRYEGGADNGKHN